MTKKFIRQVAADMLEQGNSTHYGTMLNFLSNLGMEKESHELADYFAECPCCGVHPYVAVGDNFCKLCPPQMIKIKIICDRWAHPDYDMEGKEQ